MTENHAHRFEFQSATRHSEPNHPHESVVIVFVCSECGLTTDRLTGVSEFNLADAYPCNKEGGW